MTCDVSPIHKALFSVMLLDGGSSAWGVASICGFKMQRQNIVIPPHKMDPVLLQSLLLSGAFNSSFTAQLEQTIADTIKQNAPWINGYSLSGEYVTEMQSQIIKTEKKEKTSASLTVFTLSLFGFV